MATPEAPTTIPPRMFSPLNNSFSLKDQKPAGSPWNPLQWPAWFTYQKGKLNLPSPGKFERLHSEATKGKVCKYSRNCRSFYCKLTCSIPTFFRIC